MSNTSATGGYLRPVGVVVTETDTALEDGLQAHVVGITGLEGAYVRPRWQPTAPKQPEPDINWAAIGVMTTTPDDGPAFVAQNDQMLNVRHEVLEVLASFYGPDAEQYAKRLRDGLAIPQNNDQLKTLRASLIETLPVRTVPELFNQQWVRRYDLMFLIRRQCVTAYAVQPFIAPPTIDLSGG